MAAPFWSPLRTSLRSLLFGSVGSVGCRSWRACDEFPHTARSGKPPNPIVRFRSRPVAAEHDDDISERDFHSTAGTRLHTSRTLRLQRITLTCGRDGRESADESGMSTSQNGHIFL